MTGMVRVLVVDDSAFARRTLRRLLEEEPRIRVVGTAENGTRALELVEELDPTVITLDLEMPRLGGFPFLRILMKRHPKPVVVVSSYAGRLDVFRALDLGAVDFVAKPTARASSALETIGDELRRKVLAAAAARLHPAMVARRLEDATGFHRAIPFRGDQQGQETPPAGVCILVASTGGPRAVRDVLQQLFLGTWSCVVAVHMPAGFTAGFAERLADKTGLPVEQAKGGDRLLPGRVLVAPGGSHLLVERDASGWPIATLCEPSSWDRHVPSADRLLASAAATFGDRVAAAVLTGMGSDGLEGARHVKERGGVVLAESESTAVVYGMPRSVAEAGLADRVLPLDRMAVALTQIARERGG